MSEEEKQIHLYMHSKNELGLATLCVEKDKEIERLNNIINEYETRFKIIKEIVEDNILEELNSLEYSMMMSTISSVCDGKPGFLKLGVDKE